MKMRIDYRLNNFFIKEGLKVFLVDNIQPRRVDFINWLRWQVKLFGSDYESCWGENCRETPDNLDHYWNKWFTDKQ